MKVFEIRSEVLRTQQYILLEKIIPKVFRVLEKYSENRNRNITQV